MAYFLKISNAPINCNTIQGGFLEVLNPVLGVREWMSKYILHEPMDVIIYPFHNLS